MSRVTHGQSGTPTYSSWSNMIQRCTNKDTPCYPRYGGRGITVCEKWRSFSAFLEDMGSRPYGRTLDRIDNSRGYEPGNCRWSTLHEQMKNTRSARLIVFNGKTQPLAAWARDIGISRPALRRRLARWPLERAMEARS